MWSSSCAHIARKAGHERTIEGRSEELLKGKNFGNVATLRADGTVQARRSGSTCRTACRPSTAPRAGPGRKNLERDPHLTLTVQNMENPYEYVEIRGQVAERTHEGADEHIDALAKKYLDAG